MIASVLKTTSETYGGKGFDLLDLHIYVSTEIGEKINHHFREKAAKDNDVTFDVLVRLHARSIRIALEAATLLKTGFPLGAHARWRVLHELAVVSFLVKEGGNDLAERYLLHEGIQAYKAALGYQEHAIRLGYDPLTPEEFDEIKSHHDDLLSKYGANYRHEYGWASDYLGNARPNFATLESAVLLEHMRPWYRFASNDVHANSKGLFPNLGLPEQQYGADSEILLSGRTNMHFTDPAHSIAISLTQVSSQLAAHCGDADAIVGGLVLDKLSTKVGETFWAIQQKMDTQEQAIGQPPS